MDALISRISAVFTGETTALVIQAVVILFVGFSLAVLIKRRLGLKSMSGQQRMLVSKVSSYAVIGVTVVWALKVLGVEMGVLLGAAGVLTVAIGFASQTSASNIISGLFLMGERPFVVGDTVTVGDTTGSVLSIDLLSVKLRTYSNLLIRIPNETMLKSNVTNLSHFPIRRVDMKIGVAYKEDLERVREILFEVADRNPLALTEPKPIFIFLGYGDSSLNFQFSVWAAQANYWDLSTQMYMQVKKAFDEHGIEIPFPHRTLYTGSETKPLPVHMVTKEPDAF